jgi:AraC-like DNA-binding protein
MKKADLSYEEHLITNDYSVSPGGEWAVRSSGWTVIQVQCGAGNWLQSKSSTQIETGTMLLVAGDVPGRIRASQLNGLSLFSFNVIPARLNGLITFEEREFLDQMAEQGLKVLPRNNPTALKLEELRDSQDGNGLFFRLMLLKLFLEALGADLTRVTVFRRNGDARERLRSFLAETPPEKLLETSFRELARLMNCTPRHLSRTFNESVGTSFRDKRAEIQLARARDLLANSDSKIVDVALESGYKSLSLFNMMFSRHFGISPGRWRQQNTMNRGRKAGAAGRGGFRFRQSGKRLAVKSESRAAG